MDEINEQNTAPRKRTIKPPVEEIVITKPSLEVEEPAIVPVTEATLREIEAGRKALENYR
jgi:hypothetical protein